MTTICHQRLYDANTENQYVVCPKCHQAVGLRHDINGLGIGWFDPYCGDGGRYVHYNCLSQQRLAEIRES